MFDICVGLPLPWFIKSMSSGLPVPVESSGMLLSIGTLWVMVAGVFLVILAQGWKLTKLLGILMIVGYLVFVVQSLIIEYVVY